MGTGWRLNSARVYNLTHTSTALVLQSHFFEFLFLNTVQKLALFFGGSFFKILSPSTLWSSLWPLSLSLL